MSSGRGKVYEFDDLKFWAENGMVSLLDERDGSFTRISPFEWIKRARAIGAESRLCIYPDERKKYEETANNMVFCAQEAIRQGSPVDPRAVEHHLRHRSDRKRIVLPPLSASDSSHRFSGEEK